MKKRKKYARHAVDATLILAACIVPVAFLCIKQKREKIETEIEKDGITQRTESD